MSAKETKEERFIRIAESRVNRVLHEIKLIGNLASRNYEFDEQQVDKIIKALNREVRQLRQTFAEALQGDSKKSFKL